MAMTFDDFMAASGAEFVAGNIIHGVMADRKILGTYDGVFQLNEAGQAMQAELEAAERAETPKRGRAKAEKAEKPAEAPAEQVPA
jgi:hypothetical protein